MPNPILYHRLSTQNFHMLTNAEVFDGPIIASSLEHFVSDPGHELIFATRGERVIGFASGQVQHHPDKLPSFYINELGVEENERRAGIGSTLLSKLVDLARSHSCSSLWLVTDADNHAALGLYRHLGAEETQGVVVFDWPSPQD